MAMENSQFGKASDFYEDISEVCQPCSAEGKRLQADRFCVECEEYLCHKCSTHHKNLKATRDHVLVTIDDAKNVKPAPTKDKCSYTCSEHKGKSLKYFCVSHSYLGCSVCMTMDHNQCQKKYYIPIVAENIRKHDGFKKFDEKLKSLETACKACIADVENSVKLVGADERQLKEAIKEFRKTMNNALDTWENELTTQARRINIEETKSLNVLSKKLATSLSDVNTLIKQVDTLLCGGKNCDAYVLMKKEEIRLVALNEEIVNTTKGKAYQRYEFQPNNDVLKAGAFGKLSIRTESVSLRSEETMSSKSNDDPANMTVARPGNDAPTRSRSKELKPGTRVKHSIRDWGVGTVEDYYSSRGRWRVRWDYGFTGYHTTDELVILKEQ